MFMFDLFVEAATKQKSSAVSMPVMIGLIAGVIAIIVIVIVCNIIGKKKGKELGDKFLSELQAEHPFQESVKGAHITKDGYLIWENYQGNPINKSSSSMTRAQKRIGYLAYIYKLSDIKSISSYVYNLKIQGYGNILKTEYKVLPMDEDLKPLTPQIKCTGKLDKKIEKAFSKGDIKEAAINLDSEEDSVKLMGMIKAAVPSVREADFEKVQEKAKKR
ncbi:MAG: hypothetical protein IKM88_14370 [Lachnospiraceae bacterium]|nr:hypothetical protein [Clostridiales bacterium]MBR6851405.1 hypothetical protein [Lachnospiraceae bacterium]